MQNFKERISQTKAFIFDVDGVMTDGGIMPIEGGTDFIRKYNAKDGYAIAYAIRRGYKVCIISGGHGNLLRSRLERLGVSRMYLNCIQQRTGALSMREITPKIYLCVSYFYPFLYVSMVIFSWDDHLMSSLATFLKPFDLRTISNTLSA